jgi:regulator of protease activity HflC (stomatin/prohibitin superfamily)
MLNKHLQTLWTMEQEGSDRAYIYRLTAGENAKVTVANAELSARVTIAEAEARSASMERGGDIAYETGNANASAAMWGGIGNAIAGIGNVAQMWPTAPPATQLPTQFQMTNPTGFNNTIGWMNPAANFTGLGNSSMFGGGWLTT